MRLKLRLTGWLTRAIGNTATVCWAAALAAVVLSPIKANASFIIDRLDTRYHIDNPLEWGASILKLNYTDLAGVSNGSDDYDTPYSGFPSFSPYDLHTKIVSKVPEELEGDVRRLEDMLPVLYELSVVSRDGSPIHVSNLETYLVFEIPDTGNPTTDFGGNQITLWKQAPGTPNDFSYVADIREAIANNGGKVSLPNLDGTFNSEETFAVYKVVFAAVFGRFVFYNDSAFDGNDPAASTADDGAIATDKTALLPGETATFANYTSYSRGINGVMVDIAKLTTAPVAADFEFKVGNTNDSSTWVAAPAPTSISVRMGAGVGGADRVTIIWADGAITNTWLQITVKATAVTGLSAPDVFYFGNAIGETGNSPTDAQVTPADEIDVRNNPHNLKDNPAAIDDAYDFNRDKKVGPTDQVISRNNGTNSSTALQLITVP